MSILKNTTSPPLSRLLHGPWKCCSLLASEPGRHWLCVGPPLFLHQLVELLDPQPPLSNTIGSIATVTEAC